MNKGRRRIIFGAVVCGMFVAAATVTIAANDPRGLDLRDEDRGRPSPLLPIPDAAAPQPANKPIPRGNPLWGITMKMLKATRERPLFSPSRRPPARVMAAPRVAPINVAPPEPEQPPLNLLGVVTGNHVGYAVFINTKTQDTVRLRTGEGHGGWILQSVKRREAVLENNRRTAVLSLPQAHDNKK